MSDSIGGLSVGMVNFIVVLVILGAAFFTAMGWGFYRMFKGAEMSFDGPKEPGQDQINYMRQVRYRTRLALFASNKGAYRNRDSGLTEEGKSSVHY